MSTFDKLTSNSSPALYSVLSEKANVMTGQTEIKFCMNFKISQSITNNPDGTTNSIYTYYQMIDSMIIPNFMRPYFTISLNTMYLSMKDTIEEKIDDANIPIQ